MLSKSFTKKHFLRTTGILLCLALLLFLVQGVFAGSIWDVNNTLYPDDTNCTAAIRQCHTIQAAVSAASAGDSIQVAAGTYAEGPQLIVNKDITIGGAGQGTTIIKPTANTGASGDSRGWFVVEADKVLNLSELTLDGSGYKVFQAIRHKGSGAITNVTFTNIQYEASGPAYSGMAVAAFGSGAVDITGCTFNAIGRIGVLYFGSGVNGSLYSGNNYTGKGDGDWLDYGVEVGAGAVVDIENSIIRDNRGVASVDGSTSAAILVTTYYGAGSQSEIIGNVLMDNSTGIAVGFDASDTSLVIAHQNSFMGNDYGVTSTKPLVNAEHNWWGDVSGPYDPNGTSEVPVCGDPAIDLNADGLGDEVSDDVDYCPWLNYVPPEVDLQPVIDASCGGVVLLGPHTYPGGYTLSCPVTIRGVPGTIVGHGSPAFTISGDDVVIENLTLDGSGDTHPGVLVLAGADNATLRNCEIRSWQDGVQVAGDVASFKLVSNFIHDNTGAGLQVDSGVSIGGIVTIEGNLFKANGGNGIQNDSAATLKAEYNSWGHMAGPASGDGVSSNVNAEPFSFVEFFMDVIPDTGALVRNVDESTSFDVKLKAEAAGLYGLSFKLTYDADKLQLNSQAFSAPWDGACEALGTPTPGVLAYRCNLMYPAADWNGGDLLTLNFTATGSGLSGNGTWESFFDIYHEVGETSAAAQGGVKVFVNNAGYGDPSSPSRDITDTDDGKLVIRGIGQFTGYIDLQGRSNDAGAWVKIYHQQAKSGSVQLANASSNAGGAYTTSYIFPNLLTVGTDYWLLADARLCLPTTALVDSHWAHHHLLTTRPKTTLATLVLLGGDATNNDKIELTDATCIGNDYGKTSGFTECGGSGSNGLSDVNEDGVVDILDLVLMGTNYEKGFSPWTP